MQCVFLCGLGSNRYHAYDLQDALAQDLLILELPGHGHYFHTPAPDLAALTDWFGQAIAPYGDVVLIAHSMGANLAPYLACHFPQVKKVVLLDGGYVAFDQIMSLEEELIATKKYLEETIVTDLEDLLASQQADSPIWSCHQERALRESFTPTKEGFGLALHHETVLDLLRLQRQVQGWLEKVTCPILLIPQTGACPDWKTEMLTKLPPNIAIAHLDAVGHSPHLEQPKETAQAIQSFLNR